MKRDVARAFGAIAVLAMIACEDVPMLTFASEDPDATAQAPRAEALDATTNEPARDDASAPTTVDARVDGPAELPRATSDADTDAADATDAMLDCPDRAPGGYKCCGKTRCRGACEGFCDECVRLNCPAEKFCCERRGGGQGNNGGNNNGGNNNGGNNNGGNNNGGNRSVICVSPPGTECE